MKIATLSFDNSTYDYYCFNCDGEILRVDKATNETNSYAYWDIDILTCDLCNENVDIIYLDEDIENYYLTENDYKCIKEYGYIINNIRNSKLSKGG